MVGACLGIGKLRGKMPVVILVAGGWLLGLYVVGATGTWWEFASLVGMSWLGFAIAQALLRAAEGVFRKTIGVGELRAGMIPTVSLATDRADGEGLSGAESDPAGELLIEKGLPLDAAGLAVLEAAMARGSLEKHWPVEIEGTIPCAPMLLGGVFVTVLLRGSPMNEITSALSALF